MSDNFNQRNAPADKSDDDALVEQLYNDLISSICIDVAAGMHRMAKTGELPLSDVMIPRGDETTKEDADENNGSLKRRRIGSDEQTKINEDTKRQDTEMRLRTRGASSGIDAWGRIPPKDVLTCCSNCTKILSATRFAAHLDKCLGVGNSRGSISRH